MSAVNTNSSITETNPFNQFNLDNNDQAPLVSSEIAPALETLNQPNDVESPEPLSPKRVSTGCFSAFIKKITDFFKSIFSCFFKKDVSQETELDNPQETELSDLSDDNLESRPIDASNITEAAPEASPEV